MKVPPFPHRHLPPAEGSRRTLLLLPHEREDESALLKLGFEFDDRAGRLLPLLFARDSPLRPEGLAEFVRDSIDAYGVGEVVAIGYAEGASAAVSLLLRAPEILAAAALLHPTLPLRLQGTPDLAGKPVFMSASEDDPFVAPEEFLRLHRALHRYGAQVSTGWFPRRAGLSKEEIRAVATWLAELPS